MLRPNPSLYPPGGYKYTANGRTWTGDSWADLARQVENFRRSAGIAVGNPTLEIFEDFCRKHPTHCVETEIKKVFVDIANTDIGFGRRVVAWVANTATKIIRGAMATPIADARAEICKRCPEQSSWHGSCGCDPKNVEAVARSFFKNLGHGPTPDTNGLLACRALGEDCRLSVWMSQPAKDVGQPGNCWRKV